MSWAPNALADAVGAARTIGPEHTAPDGNAITLSPSSEAGSIVVGYTAIGMQHDLIITQAALQAVGVTTRPWVAHALALPSVDDPASMLVGSRLDLEENIHLARGAAQVLGFGLPSGADGTTLALTPHQGGW
jgi:hypothetical protein